MGEMHFVCSKCPPAINALELDRNDGILDPPNAVCALYVLKYFFQILMIDTRQ